ncbi:Transcription elongation factor Elf1 like family protein [Leishmania donovani]|uniref:Transcription elongation factor Elf1 like family protein n=2 Tax=Leishmania donovani TaxID=5661 RepID=A0A504XM44_LEIDO|nr:Transcription elongation factor Elf1 like family protein [Leishmania donovani]
MGGKRKKSNNGPVKKESKYKIPTRFDCPLCDTKASIVVRIFRATSDATVRCRVCGTGGTKRWNVLRLEKPVDVFFRFHEALIQRDHADLQQVEMGREAKLSVGAPNADLGGSHSSMEKGAYSPGDAAVAGWARLGSSAAAAATASGSSHSQHVRSLGELQRKLTMPTWPGFATAPTASCAVDLRDDYEGEAEGAAAHYFAPRQEVHSAEDEDDEYDQLFQNTIRVTLNPRLGQGTVCCTYCCSLRPAPPDLPYPSVQNFVPSLENKADVFFRFNEQYAALLRQHENERVGESAGLSSCLATVDNTRKRANKDDGESGGRTRAPRGESMDEDGLFGDCALRMDTGLLDNAVDQHVTGAPAMFGSDDDGGGNTVADADPVNPKGVSTPSPPRPDGADMPESNFMNVAVITGVDEAFAAHATDDVNGIGEADAEEVDVAAFFADSD